MKPSFRLFFQAFFALLLLSPFFLQAQDWVHTGTNLGQDRIRLAAAEFKPLSTDPQTPSLKAVFDAVPVGIVITEAATGRVVISNPQAEKVFRRPVIMADKIENYRNAGALHPDGSPMMPSEYPLARAIVTGNPVGPEEFLYRGLDGSDGWVSATAAPVRGRDGQILGGVVALLDIDDLKRERQALLDRISELERQVLGLRSPLATE